MGDYIVGGGIRRRQGTVSPKRYSIVIVFDRCYRNCCELSCGWPKWHDRIYRPSFMLTDSCGRYVYNLRTPYLLLTDFRHSFLRSWAIPLRPQVMCCISLACNMHRDTSRMLDQCSNKLQHGTCAKNTVRFLKNDPNLACPQCTVRITQCTAPMPSEDISCESEGRFIATDRDGSGTILPVLEFVL
jgi:hypothetical protein